MSTNDNQPNLDPKKLLDAVASAGAGDDGVDYELMQQVAERLPGYELLGYLGRGGMGTVYRARDRRLGRPVAIKVLHRELADDPGFAERFEREAKALAQLNHPHILTLYEFGESQGVYFLATEYVDGMSLRQLQDSGRLSAEEALNMLPQICDALQFAHDHGVVHRDIKPENILVDESGRVRLADFGLAKLANIERGAPTLTQSQQVFGTVQYMAPEQMRGVADVDHRADIFSLGVLTYELLTGALPVGRFDEPSKVSAVGRSVDGAVMRSLESDPERRYQRVADFGRDINEAPRGSEASTDGDARVCWLPLWSLLWLGLGFAASAIILLAGSDGWRLGPGDSALFVLAIAAPIVIGFGICQVLGIVALLRIRRAKGRLIGLPLALLFTWGLPLYGAVAGVLVNLWMPSYERTDYPVLLILAVMVTTFTFLFWQYQVHAAAAFGTTPVWRRKAGDHVATMLWSTVVVLAVIASMLFQSVAITDSEARRIVVMFAAPVLFVSGAGLLRHRYSTLNG